ncbi:MAG: tetratricopeptide repeat protein, partial [Anaerolineae bacterium]|nr:tetratricopeptide repeat protein [Anaerolineae bacterium]
MSRQSNIFFRKPTTNPYRIFLLLVFILGGIWLIRQVELGNIQRPFLPTPTPTRVAKSYALEGDAQFEAGKLEAAITAYQEATRVDPANSEVWAKLARIQTYSSVQLTTDDQQRERLQEGLASINKAVELAPDDSTVHAIRAFVLDWNANSILFGTEQAADYLLEAEQEAVRALQLDNQNTLALAYYAEILVDAQKWSQGEQYINQAVEQDDTLMDVHRVNAYVLESLGQYNQAIQEYDKALAISPNLTFLYLRAGANYRRLAFDSPNGETRTQLYENSLEYFAKAARLNEQLGILDPIPYLSISKTYSQEGEFFIAARNV